MSDDGSGGNPMSSVLGAVSISTVINKLLDQAAPVISQTIGIDLNVVITGFVFVAMIGTSWYHIQRFISDLFEQYYSCTVRMTSEDSMFAATMEYLEERKVFGTPAEQEARRRANRIAGIEDEICGILKGKGGMAWYARPTRNIDANMDSWKLDMFFDDSDDDQDGSDDEEVSLDSDDDKVSTGATDIAQRIKIKKRVKYAPSPSYAHYFYFRPTGHTVKVVRVESNNNGAWWRRQREHLSLSIYGRDQTPLKMFLALVVDRENKKDIGRTTVFKAMPGQDAGPRWIRCFSRATRPIDTVVLDEDQKTRICDDIAEYLMPATRKWYGNRGLPYRRGYLLYGPPGTGKTSLTVALAGRFGLRVYSLSLSAVWMNDDTLGQLFSHLPKTCIVLLEDIDACGVTREGDTKAAAAQAVVENNAGQTTSPNTTTASVGTRVTFSGLLNALDGVASKEGRLLIMTTNHRERLDEALLRPGRCDLQIKFNYADRIIIHDLFRALYQVDDASRTILRFPKNFPTPKELDELASEFAAKVPEGVFSPAEVQGHLLKYKKEPRKALELVEEWIEETKREHMERRLREEREKAEAAKREAEEKEKAAKENEKTDKEKAASDTTSESTDSLPDDVKINGTISD